MPDIFKGNPNHIGHIVLHLLILAFCLLATKVLLSTRHRHPKGNAHIETATIKEIILKCLQPIGTHTAAAGASSILDSTHNITSPNTLLCL